MTGAGVRIATGSFAKSPVTHYRPRLAQPVQFTNLGVDVRMAEVDNPYYSRAHKDEAEDPTNPRKIAAARNSNESPLVRLEMIGSLDPRQARAGHLFRQVYERMMAGQASPSFIQERVDGGSAPDAFTEGRARASRQLRIISEAMTEADYNVVRFVCGEGRSLRELDRVLEVRKGTSKGRLLAALDRLADVLGLGKPKQRDG
ncbi:hypothetical protein ACLNGM_09995 [Aureimonas phyllosphaerae]|uniref:hypothetical protein n=1 Tax=Aureimonas phyllosphaerae TaxID=1166078 RepID=UPI003A5C1E7B